MNYLNYFFCRSFLYLIFFLITSPVELIAQSTCSDLIAQDKLSRIEPDQINRFINVRVSTISHDILALYGSYYNVNINFPNEDHSIIVGIVFANKELQEKVYELSYQEATFIPDHSRAYGRIVYHNSRVMFLLEGLRLKGSSLHIETGGSKVVKFR